MASPLQLHNCMKPITSLLIVSLAFFQIAAYGEEQPSFNSDIPDYASKYADDYTDNREENFEPSQASLMPALDPGAFVNPSNGDENSRDDGFIVRTEPMSGPELPLD